jgi:hypothetical protein
LRQHGLLQVQHQAHHAGRVLSCADAADVWVVGLDLGHQLAQRGVQVNAFYVHGQPRGAGHKNLFGRELPVGLNGHA